MDDIRAEIIQLLEETQGIPVPPGADADLCAEMGFDSLSLVALLLKLEEIYSISFEIAELGACLRVNQLLALVEQKLRKGRKA